MDFKKEFNIELIYDKEIKNIKDIYECLKILPKDILNKLNINKIILDNLGIPEKDYPNKGSYKNGIIVLNEKLYKMGNFYKDVSWVKFVFMHEIAHAIDEIIFNKDKENSYEKDWLKLSQWNKNKKMDNTSITIVSEKNGILKSDWFYSNDAKFVRDYSKMSPLEDWADCCACYLLKCDNIPKEKKYYFDKMFSSNIKIAQDIIKKIKKQVSAGVIITNGINFLIAHPTKGSINQWDLPKGKVEENESHIDGAIREVKEEIGLIINKKDLVDLGLHIYLPTKDLHLFLYKIKELPSITNYKCNSFFEDKGGKKLPEMDKVAYINYSEIDKYFSVNKNLGFILKEVLRDKLKHS